MILGDICIKNLIDPMHADSNEADKWHFTIEMIFSFPK